ncbi:hypothetical protein EV356DRAFT_565955 [Viridothelium virens]|uniref:Uncharacterized protein n=1 Tax=Viridothelium virens TaxID=1048519 RepID=A0A6A6HDL5_VIRVR|nr:hypothetical protein EV356DRAFT_565955 [Viridothelium virens]
MPIYHELEEGTTGVGPGATVERDDAVRERITNVNAGETDLYARHQRGCMDELDTGEEHEAAGEHFEADEEIDSATAEPTEPSPRSYSATGDILDLKKLKQDDMNQELRAATTQEQTHHLRPIFPLPKRRRYPERTPKGYDDDSYRREGTPSFRPFKMPPAETNTVPDPEERSSKEIQRLRVLQINLKNDIQNHLLREDKVDSAKAQLNLHTGEEELYRERETIIRETRQRSQNKENGYSAVQGVSSDKGLFQRANGKRHLLRRIGDMRCSKSQLCVWQIHQDSFSIVLRICSEITSGS